MRCWVRLHVERKKNLTLPDYCVWGGWLFTFGWFVCSVIALNLQLTHPLQDPDLTTDSVVYLKVSGTEHLKIVTSNICLDGPFSMLFLRRGAVLSQVFHHSVLLVAHPIGIPASSHSRILRNRGRGLLFRCYTIDRHIDCGYCVIQLVGFLVLHLQVDPQSNVSLQVN